MVTDDLHLLMDALRTQQTIARPARVEGFGYWYGEDVQVEFRPASADTGIVFVRDDLVDSPRITACVANQVEGPLRTSLQSGGAGVDMVEHVMAALAGLDIDNCEVRVNAREMPGCDGSSLPFVEALCRAGLVVQEARKPRRVVDEVIRLGSRESWIEVSPSLSGHTILEYVLDYGDTSPIGRQTYLFSPSPLAFRAELAPCRTFLHAPEAAELLDRGLGLRVTNRDLLLFGESGPIDNTLRFHNECVRHKLLDLVGDLALARCDLVGHFRAYRSGHRLNGAMVRALEADAPFRVAPRRRTA